MLYPNILKSIFLLTIFALLSQSAFGQRNVLNIIADGLGSDYYGFYENPLDTVNLSNVRRLLKSGVRFKNGWANPFCYPT
jgi:arylsulfatase A-like enzyme